jgi:dihydroorotase
LCIGQNESVRFDLLIQRGLVTSSDGIEQADVGVLGGRIEEVGDLAGASAEQVIDATDLHVLPGVIDTQVHFREPGMEHKEDLESGTRAAVMGGVTSVFEMPNTQPSTTTLEALKDKLRRAQGRAWCNYSFFVGATAENVAELGGLELAEGTPGIKIFMGSSTGSLLVADDDTLRSILSNGTRRCPVHAEDHYRLEQRKALLSDDPHPREHPFLRDEECARLATERLLALSQETRRPVHILHVSTAEELPMIRAAKARGLKSTAEITPQHLFFQAPECYEQHGSLAQMNPPLRERRHQQALRRAVQEGLFDVIGSDHAPHTMEEKAQPYPKSPSGMPGVQTLLPVMLNFVNEGLFRLRDFVRMACEGPTQIYGIRDKGFISAGYDADLVLVDLKARRVVQGQWLQSKCGWSPYEGLEMQGWPMHVVVGGQHVVREGELVGEPSGQPVKFDWKE